MTGLLFLMWVRQNLHIQNRSFLMVIFVPEVKSSFSLRFAIKLNKYLYNNKFLPLTCICGTKLIQRKLYVRSYCYVNFAWNCNFRNLNKYLRDNCMVKSKSGDTPLRSGIREKFEVKLKKLFFVGQCNWRVDIYWGETCNLKIHRLTHK